jgi:hypothetical protein
MKVGSVWNAGWDVDVAAVMACGGDKGKVAVWDIRENADVMRRYGKELGGAGEADAGVEERKADSEPVESKEESADSNAVAANMPVEGKSAEKKRKKQKRKSGKSTTAAAAAQPVDDES